MERKPKVCYLFVCGVLSVCVCVYIFWVSGTNTMNHDWISLKVFAIFVPFWRNIAVIYSTNRLVFEKMHEVETNPISRFYLSCINILDWINIFFVLNEINYSGFFWFRRLFNCLGFKTNLTPLHFEFSFHSFRCISSNMSSNFDRVI